MSHSPSSVAALFASKTARLRQYSRRNIDFKRLHEAIMAFRAKAKPIEYVFNNAVQSVAFSPHPCPEAGGMAGKLD
jgi:hypothetical protein